MQANAVQRTAEEGCLPIPYITLQQKGLHLHVHPRLALERNLDIHIFRACVHVPYAWRCCGDVSFWFQADKGIT